VLLAMGFLGPERGVDAYLMGASDLPAPIQ